MSSNENLIKQRYADPFNEDARASRSRAFEQEFYYTKKILSEYINCETKVAEIGCATGYYAMYFGDKCKSYLGVDMCESHVELFNKKAKQAQLKNASAIVGDATNLKNIKDEMFDVVLVLGPMYHLPQKERACVFAESKRICKKNGIIAYAYINKAGAYVKACIIAPEVYPNRNANEYLLKKGTDDIHPDLFFFTMPEEFEQDAVSNGLKIIKNTGVDFIFNENLINDMQDEKFEAWLELSDLMTESESCTGMSVHALLICKNETD